MLIKNIHQNSNCTRTQLYCDLYISGSCKYSVETADLFRFGAKMSEPVCLNRTLSSPVEKKGNFMLQFQALAYLVPIYIHTRFFLV
jgi:hypothetical protein